MARKPRVEVEGGLYHVITRGNNRQAIFNPLDKPYLTRIHQHSKHLTFNCDEDYQKITVALSLPERYSSCMATVIEVEKLALDLPERERARLAANLLESLPGVLSDEDEGIAEALRRDADLDANPDHVISLAQLDSQIQNRRS
jgi:hypothetical protein